VQIGQRFERQIGIDRAGAVADQQAEMMRLAGFAGFDHQAALRARAFADQVMMHRGGGQQAGDRRQFFRSTPRSDRTRIDAPSLTALAAATHSASTAFSSPLRRRRR
jgi:hypothetical protein